jgi:hypothetical protein
MRISVRTLLLVGVTLLLPLGINSAAQPLVRGVSGTVTDRHRKPVQGAVVQIEDMNLLGLRSYITQGDGKFHFPNLSWNDDYQLRAAYHGAEGHPKILSHFDSGDAKVINLQVPVPK